MMSNAQNIIDRYLYILLLIHDQIVAIEIFIHNIIEKKNIMKN